MALSAYVAMTWHVAVHAGVMDSSSGTYLLVVHYMASTMTRRLLLSRPRYEIDMSPTVRPHQTAPGILQLLCTVSELQAASSTAKLPL